MKITHLKDMSLRVVLGDNKIEFEEKDQVLWSQELHLSVNSLLHLIVQITQVSETLQFTVIFLQQVYNSPRIKTSARLADKVEFLANDKPLTNPIRLFQLSNSGSNHFIYQLI